MNTPETSAGLHLAYARSDTARSIIAAAKNVLPVASTLWDQVDDALADVSALGAVIARLSAELAETRIDRANLLAAMQATIGAQADGEADPLYYLRDELQARQGRSADHGGPS